MDIRTFAALVVLAVSTWPTVADAFTVSISPGSRALYLRVGDGGASGYYRTGGISALSDHATINAVSATVPTGAVGNGTALAMTSNSTQTVSHYDGYAFCNPGQVYIGGFYRTYFPWNSGTLSVTAPAWLVNASGDRIPFSQISWTTSGNGDAGAQPVPSGTFATGQQALANYPANSWRESCMSFRYANSVVVPAGQYTGRVTYTLAAP